MTIRFYGVLDADGIKVSTITADEALINTDWYPGYGAMLVDEGAVPPDPPPAPPVVRPKSWAVISQLAKPMEQGDKLDLKTLTVTKAPVADVAIAAEPL